MFLWPCLGLCVWRRGGWKGGLDDGDFHPRGAGRLGIPFWGILFVMYTLLAEIYGAFLKTGMNSNALGTFD